MSKIIASALQNRILEALRPPSARRSYVVSSYANDGIPNRGYTLRLEPGEPVVSPGSGTVRHVRQVRPGWRHSSGLLDSSNVWDVVIDHGQSVFSVVSGLQGSEVRVGQAVSRGDRLGLLVTDECFFQCYVAGAVVNPADISRHWIAEQGDVVPGQSHKLRFSPDKIARSLANNIVRMAYSGIHYFQNALQPQRLLVNVDFNGAGSKTGLAKVGYTQADYWNVYAAGAFLKESRSGYYGYSMTYYSCQGTYFSRQPDVFLYDSSRNKTSIRLERVSSASAASGTSAWFDPMLSTYIGGYAAGLPEENFFALKGMPAGTYELYLYANDGALPNTSTFYVSVDTGGPTVKSTAPTTTAAFVENQNVVKFTLVIGSSSYITVKAYGYFAGLQLVKL